jgi:hypothetical protein
MSEDSQNRMLRNFDPEAFMRVTKLGSKLADSLPMLEKNAAKRTRQEVENELVRSMHRDYDGMDVYIDGGGNIECRPWDEGGEPIYPPWDAPFRRIDLRNITYSDLREAHEKLND